MATCEKRVSGRIMSYPCVLDAGHERNGPYEDPEPCMTPEVEPSVRVHEYWVNREEARKTLPETLEDIEADVLESAAEAEVAEPEHNLRDGNCMMRPFNGPEVAGDPDEVCPVCSGTRRPQILIDNDEAIRAGEIHNPFAEACTKRIGVEISLDGERCWICQPDSVAEAPEFSLALPPTQEEIDRMIGRGEVAPSLEGIPGVTQPLHGIADLGVPTKQRPGDQVLPAGGDRPVQDWMIQREHERYRTELFETQDLPDAESGALIIRAMTESKRVGIERYGQPLHTFDGRLNIRDLADELRDAFVYISKLQMTAEADKATLVEMVAQALASQDIHPAAIEDARRLAEIAVDRILDWVLIQKIGPEQVVPVREP